MKKSSKKTDLIIKILASILIVSILLKLFVIDFYKIEGNSMHPAIKSGSTVAVFKLSYGLDLPFSDKSLFSWSSPKKDDVVFYMHNDKMVIKRCAATSGDKLEYYYDFGYNLLVNGKSIPLDKSQYEKLKNTDRVPENTILALGDNIEYSVDSRTYGFIPVKNILGRVLCR